jgi:hypothetical protein
MNIMIPMNTMSSSNGTHSVNFAMSYKSAVGRTPLILEVESSWTMMHRIS